MTSTSRNQPGVGFHTRDVLVGTEHDVTERSASRTMQAGDSLFGQIVTCDGVTLLEACGPYVVSPLDKIRLIDLRERMQASATGLTRTQPPLDQDIVHDLRRRLGLS